MAEKSKSLNPLFARQLEKILAAAEAGSSPKQKTDIIMLTDVTVLQCTYLGGFFVHCIAGRTLGVGLAIEGEVPMFTFCF